MILGSSCGKSSSNKKAVLLKNFKTIDAFYNALRDLEESDVEDFPDGDEFENVTPKPR